MQGNLRMNQDEPHGQTSSTLWLDLLAAHVQVQQVQRFHAVIYHQNMTGLQSAVLPIKVALFL